jgi:small-conductance mechanosensitive channel
MKDMMYLNELTRATRRREFEDGLFDLMLAVIFFIIGLLGWLFFSPWLLHWYIESLIINREVTIIVLIALPALFLLIIFAIRQFIEYIRRSLLWRDSGYVKSLRWQVKRSTSLIAGAVAIIMTVCAFWLMQRGWISPEDVLRTLVASASVATGVVFVGVGVDLRLRRYIYIGVSGIFLSSGLLFLPNTFSKSWLMFGSLWLILLLLSGIWALRAAILTIRE